MIASSGPFSISQLSTECGLTASATRSLGNTQRFQFLRNSSASAHSMSTYRNKSRWSISAGILITIQSNIGFSEGNMGTINPGTATSILNNLSIDAIFTIPVPGGSPPYNIDFTFGGSLSAAAIRTIIWANNANDASFGKYQISNMALNANGTYEGFSSGADVMLQMSSGNSYSLYIHT